MKKPICLLLCLILAFACCLPAAAASPAEQKIGDFRALTEELLREFNENCDRSIHISAKVERLCALEVLVIDKTFPFPYVADCFYTPGTKQKSVTVIPKDAENTEATRAAIRAAIRVAIRKAFPYLVVKDGIQMDGESPCLYLLPPEPTPDLHNTFTALLNAFSASCRSNINLAFGRTFPSLIPVGTEEDFKTLNNIYEEALETLDADADNMAKAIREWYDPETYSGEGEMPEDPEAGDPGAENIENPSTDADLGAPQALCLFAIGMVTILGVCAFLPKRKSPAAKTKKIGGE